jgi:hypothetical protein
VPEVPPPVPEVPPPVPEVPPPVPDVPPPVPDEPPMHDFVDMLQVWLLAAQFEHALPELPQAESVSL